MTAPARLMRPFVLRGPGLVAAARSHQKRLLRGGQRVSPGVP